jgi:predicted Zn-dependent protease
MREPSEIADELIGLVPPGVEAETIVASGNLSLTRFANSFIHQNVAEDGSTVHLRVAVDGRVASADGTRSDGASLQRLVDDAVAVAKLRDADELWTGITEPTQIGDGEHYDVATAETDPKKRADMVKTFVTAGNGLLAAGYCSTEGWDVAYRNTAGHGASGRYSQAVLDGIHQTGASAGSGHAASLRVADIDAAAVGALAASRATDSAEAVDAKPGDYEVVLAPEAVGTIAVFLSAYAFNGRAAVEERSMVKPGEAQFDEAITFAEAPDDPRAITVPFDGEGMPRLRVPLVTSGVTTALTYDRRTAAKAGAASTGNHSYGPYAWFGPVGTNLFLEPGSVTLEEIIASVERGLYVSTFNYCRVLDEKTLVVTGLTRNGTFMIENGAITGAVTNLRFTQSFAAALGPGAVLAVGDDARFADSEFGPGVTFVPSLRLASWHFTGGASG